MQIQNLFMRAQQCIPGGVNSPVRAFNAVGGEPIFIKSAYGAYLIGDDDKEYIDYVGSWGPMIAGHAHPRVLNAVNECVRLGLSFGAPTIREIQLAEKICHLMPAIEQIRMVNSGTEATMSAIRLARGYTAKNKIIKFAGCYHGHADNLLVEAGSGILTLGLPSSAGVPASTIEHTLVAEFNNLNSVKAWFETFPTDVAAIIVEPVAGNMNCIPPVDGFLTGLRELCNQYNALLIFDEVMTGFRIALGGAEEVYGVRPDLITLGKIIGGGMPVGAFGGRREIMQSLAPVGPVYQAGTLSGNPVAMAAGLANVELLLQKDFYKNLAVKTRILMQGLEELAFAKNIPFKTHAVGSMFGLFFTHEDKIETFADVKKCRIDLFKKFFHAMLTQGVYLAPSAFEAGFMSAAHTEEDIAKTLAAAKQAFAMIC